MSGKAHAPILQLDTKNAMAKTASQRGSPGGGLLGVVPTTVLIAELCQGGFA